MFRYIKLYLKKTRFKITKNIYLMYDIKSVKLFKKYIIIKKKIKI